jgi:hypothetical protein
MIWCYLLLIATAVAMTIKAVRLHNEKIDIELERDKLRSDNISLKSSIDEMLTIIEKSEKRRKVPENDFEF